MKYKKSNFSKFLLLWAGEFISAIGGGLTSFGLGVYVFQQTGSAASNLWFSEESVLTWPAVSRLAYWQTVTTGVYS